MEDPSQIIARPGCTEPAAASQPEDAARCAVATNQPLRISAQSRARYLGSAQLVYEVRFLTWTADGLVRQGAYEGLTEDKPAKDVRRPRAA
jgi:ATP-dependent DNA ligase